MTIEFLLTSLIVVLLPGPGVLYTVATGLSRGGRASVVAAFGCTLGILPHAAASLLGLAALLQASAVAFHVLQYAGAAYLLWMAFGMVRGAGEAPAAGPTVAAAGGAVRLIRDAVLLNLLNPKLSVFFLAFLPLFVPATDPHAGARAAGLAGVFMAMTFAVFVVYGAFAAAARGYVLARPTVLRWMQRGFGAAFALLALRLATADR